ncbi:MAG: DUF58 domain-containing protein [Clostridia bacterium]|nr:DUF58 domain-containing protein [Clostridia bacterium]
MWRFRFVYLFCLLGAVIFHLIYQAELSVYVLLLVVFLPFLAFILCLPAMALARVSLYLPARAPLGSEIALELRLRCRFPIPTGLVRVKIKVENAFTGESAILPLEYFYGAWNETISIPIMAKHSGKLVCSVVRCKAADCLGIFSLPIKNVLPANCIVTPVPISPGAPLAKLKRIKPRFVAKKGGGFSEDHELRPYVKGDPVRSIHWKLSSKLDELIIREPLEPERKRIVIQPELKGSPSALDNVLGQLVFLSSRLLEANQRHEIINPYAPSKKLSYCAPDNKAQLVEYIDQLLRQRAASSSAKPRVMSPIHAEVFLLLKPLTGGRRR